MPTRTIVCKLQDQDNDDRIGHILSETAPEDYIWVFGSRDKAAAAITALAGFDNNCYSRRFIYTCVEVDDGEQAATTTTTTTSTNTSNKQQKRKVLGAMVGYTQDNDVNSYWDYVHALGWWYGTLVFLRLSFLLLVNEWPSLRRRRYDHFYIQDLAVHPAARGRGVGTKIINYVKMYYARRPELGVRSVSLHVAHYNGNARRLYERLGFEPQLSLKDRVQRSLGLTQYWTTMELFLFDDASEAAAHTAASSTSTAHINSNVTQRPPRGAQASSSHTSLVPRSSYLFPHSTATMTKVVR